MLASLLHGSARLRVGLVVPKHRHTVVERNRLKRRLRALLAAHWTAAWQHAPRRAEAADATDVTRDAVLYALPAAYAATFEALRADVIRLGTRAAELA